MRQVSLAGLVLSMVALGTVTPTVTRAQEARPAWQVIDQDRLTAYAKAFTAIAAARDEAHTALALPKNKTIQAQQEVRDRLRKQIEQILREQNLTQEDYTRITYVVSTDAERRKSFEEILARLTPKPSER